MSEGVSHEHTALFATSTGDSVETAFISETEAQRFEFQLFEKNLIFFFAT